LLVRYGKPNDAAQDFWRARRQVELAHADIDPHIAGAGIEERIARQPEPGDVIMRRDVLIADTDIHMAEIDDVAEVLRGAIIFFGLHRAVPSLAPQSGILIGAK
jgi:hypothetical protein